MPPHTTLFGLSVLLGFISSSTSHLNLYMNSVETFRLLGITAELYYVRNGIINNYALSFNLPIPAHISEIYFTWESLRQSPAMYYSMKFMVSNPRALRPPMANISTEGTVPNKLSVFKLMFPCTGRMSAEVDVHFQMNISIFSASNLTVLDFKRRKMCIKDDSVMFRELAKTPHKPGVPSVNQQLILAGEDQLRNSTIDKEVEPTKSRNLSTSTHIFYIAVGCACALILLIALAVAVYYLNSQKNNTRGYTERMSDTSSSQALTQQSQSFLRPETPHKPAVASSIASSSQFINIRNFPRGISPVAELRLPDIKAVLLEIAIEKKRISLGSVLLEGTFGRVYQGTLLSEDDSDFGADQEIIVKTITDQARSDQVHVFLNESCMMRGLVHPNIHTLIGASLDNERQPIILYPYSVEGNLKKFLQKCRVSECGSHYSLSTQQLVYMAIQMVRGVQFLHKKKIIHKDISTRNCVLDNDLVVRITDNALSRDLFPADYNCLGDNENRPIKWLAIEALLEHHFSSATDLWAFGVTLWELMTLGQQPYADIDPFEMAAYLQEGYRIAQPMNCPDELFSVMAYCWALNPDERLKFPQLLACLQDFYTALGRYI